LSNLKFMNASDFVVEVACSTPAGRDVYSFMCKIFNKPRRGDIRRPQISLLPELEGIFFKKTINILPLPGSPQNTVRSATLKSQIQCPGIVFKNADMPAAIASTCFEAKP